MAYWNLCHHQRHQPGTKDLAIGSSNYLGADAGLAPMNADKPLGAVALGSFQKTLKPGPQHQGHHAERQNGEPVPSVPEMSRFWSSLRTALKELSPLARRGDEALDTAAKRIVQ